jgi:hypothetical protein
MFVFRTEQTDLLFDVFQLGVAQPSKTSLFLRGKAKSGPAKQNPQARNQWLGVGLRPALPITSGTAPA